MSDPDPLDPDATAPTISGRFVALAVGAFLLLAAALAGLWLYFHTIPSEREVRNLITSAERIEIFHYADKKPQRWLKLADAKTANELADRLVFRARYWQFSDEPTESVVVQTIVGDDRTGVWDVREDGCLHLRKAVRWYRMPIEPGFAERVRELLTGRGEDVPTGQQPIPNTPR